MSFTASLEDIVAANRNGLLGAAPWWERVRLGDIATILNGFPFPSVRFTKDRGVPLLRIRDVLATHTDASYDGEVDPGFLVRSGDLVVGMDGDFNSSIWRGPVAALNQRVCKITPNDGVYDLRFLSFVLPGYLAAINAETSSITVKHLSSRTIADIPVPLPPLVEQRRIVAALDEHLSDLDAAVAGLERAKHNTKRYRQGAIAALTSGWPEVPLESLLSSQPRALQSGPFGSNLLHSEFQSTGVLAIGIDNVGHGEFLPGRQHRISQRKYQELAKYAARPGDVLITVMATIGRVCVVPDDVEDAIITKHVYRITVDPALVVPRFLMFSMLGAPSVRGQLFGEARGQTRPGLNSEILRRLLVPMPSVSQQQSIVQELDSRLGIVGRAAAEIDVQLARAVRLRQAILKRAFEGKLVPQDQSDEPATTLLERISATRATSDPVRAGRRGPRRRAASA